MIANLTYRVSHDGTPFRWWVIQAQIWEQKLQELEDEVDLKKLK